MIRTLIILALLGLTGWAATQPGGIIALLFVAAVLYLAYKRLSLFAYTATFLVLLAAYTWFGAPAGIWKGFLWLMLAGLAFLNIRPIRKALISRPFMKAYMRMLPAPCGGTASCSLASPTGRSCCQPRRRCSRPRSRHSSTAPAKSCAG